jgi:hypothetical protein
MGTTIERKGGGAVLPPHGGVPAAETIADAAQRVELHEMPDLSKEAPEVSYGQPRRSWLRYLAVGVTVGAVAVAGGLVIGTLSQPDVAPQYSATHSMAREHLAQTPGGFPPIQVDGTVGYPMTRSLDMEHIAQTPGGFPPIQVNGTVGYPMTRSLDMEHIAQTPGGFPTTVLTPPNAILE